VRAQELRRHQLHPPRGPASASSAPTATTGRISTPPIRIASACTVAPSAGNERTGADANVKKRRHSGKRCRHMPAAHDRPCQRLQRSPRKRYKLDRP
jgi:hypothetical protein